MYCKGCGPWILDLTIYRHGYSWVVIFETAEMSPPKFASAEMSIIEGSGELEMDLFDIVR